MPTNTVRWIRNLDGAGEPLVMLGLFAAGVTQAIKRGEILELTGSGGTEWVPINSDFAMNGDIAIANEEIKSGDRAGYYEIIVPRPADVFEFALAAASALTVTSPVFFSDSETVTTSGTNALGYAVGQEHYPDKQGHLSDDAGGDAGTTLRSTAYARFTFAVTASYYSALIRSNRSPNVGDSGGFTGFQFDGAGTSIQFYLDGTLVRSFETTGAATDEVS